MLIAIMGDAFDRVKEEQGRCDFQEMAALIYRYEIIAHSLCKRTKRVWKYIFVSEDVKYSGEEAIDVWQGRIRGIKTEIEKSYKKQEEWQSKFEKRYEEDLEEDKEWRKKFEEQYQADQKKNEALLAKILEQVKEVKILST